MFRWVGRIALGLAVLVVIVGTGVWFWLRTSLPTTDGTIALGGLENPVEIRRDKYGVPYIRAQNERDAHFALGFVHAQDRLWQMDFLRRAGAGRLSEVLGPRPLSSDKFMRTLGLYRLAQASIERLPPEARQTLEAYTAGINAYLASRNGAWPLEFYVLRYSPEPWHPADSLVWGKTMAMYLSRNYREELLRAAIRDRLGEKSLDTLLPAYPAAGPRTLASLLDDFRNPLAEASASNAWILSGKHTTTGKPFLANDPHLRFRTPALWYLARIEAPTLSLTGATVPGVPFMVLGHNRRIAWGMTTAETDVQDLFIEKLEPSDASWYRTPEGARPFATRTETIRVRDMADVTLEVRETRHGPVVSDLSPDLRAMTPNGHVMTLATPTLLPDDDTATALYRINRATGWQQFRDALRSWGTPHQNLSYADTDGNIGLIAPALIPIRKAGDGSVPGSGSDGTHDWKGFIPFDELPQILNPPGGTIANANNPTAPANYPYLMGRGRTPGYRAERIAQVIGTGKHDIASMLTLQHDSISLMAHDMIPLLLQTRPRTEQAGQIHAMLRGWNGVMARAIPQPLILIAWLRALDRRMFADELGPLYDHYQGLNILSIKTVLTGDRAWCDDTTTPAAETCDDTVSAALDEALSGLSAAYGIDPTRWQWGEAHVVRFDHPVLGFVPVLGSLFNVRLPADGGPFTLNRAHIDTSSAAAPYASVHGAGYRAVYDMANPDRSRFIVSPGQSGNWFSPHYDDLAALWRDGGSLTLPPNLPADADTLRLVPDRSR